MRSMRLAERQNLTGLLLGIRRGAIVAVILMALGAHLDFDFLVEILLAFTGCDEFGKRIRTAAEFERRILPVAPLLHHDVREEPELHHRLDVLVDLARVERLALAARRQA